MYFSKHNLKINIFDFLYCESFSFVLGSRTFIVMVLPTGRGWGQVPYLFRDGPFRIVSVGIRASALEI